MRRILATGTTGTIGRHFASKVEKLGIDLSKNIEIFESLPIRQSDSILHAAAIVGPSVVSKNVEHARAVNVKGVRNLATIARNKDVSRFVYVSTSHVYAPSRDLLNESSLVAPGNIYAQQKLEAENEIFDVFKDAPERICIVRVFSVLDWDVSEFTLGGGIKKLAMGVPNYILSNADDVRDFLTPKSIAEALIAITLNDSLIGVVNLSTGKPRTIKEAARYLLERSGFDFPTESVQQGNSSFPYMVGDNSKLLSFLPTLDLSWNPSHWSISGHP